MRKLVPVVLVLTLNACANNPYRGATRPNATGESTKYFFAYGKYCGPGWPDTPEGANRSEGLLAAWPPVDDLDTACYAHDYCYAITSNNSTNCDSALEFTMGKMHARLSNASMACWNLSLDVYFAFFGKFWSVGQTGGITASDRIVQFGLGIPYSGIGYLFTQPSRWVFGYPRTEGTCNLGIDSDPYYVIELFNEGYSQAVFNASKERLDIPVGPR